MTDTKFNPFDLSARNKVAETNGHDNHLQIHVRPELYNPLNLLLGRCEMFLDRAKTLQQVDTVLELQKILSTAKYLHSMINSSEVMRQARLHLELGTTFITRDDVPKAAASIASLSSSGVGDCGSLLLVDEDTSLLRALKYILEEQG